MGRGGQCQEGKVPKAEQGERRAVSHRSLHTRRLTYLASHTSGKDEASVALSSKGKMTALGTVPGWCWKTALLLFILHLSVSPDNVHFPLAFFLSLTENQLSAPP